MLTIPIFYPAALKLGFDPIWFGVVIVLVTEMGVITPPVGVNVYVVHAVVKDISIADIFCGVVYMFFALIVCNLLIFFFPEIVTILPNLLYN